MRQRMYAARDHIAVAFSLTNLGLAYLGLGEYPKTIGYHEKALAMRGSSHPGISLITYFAMATGFSMRMQP